MRPTLSKGYSIRNLLGSTYSDMRADIQRGRVELKVRPRKYFFVVPDAVEKWPTPAECGNLLNLNQFRRNKFCLIVAMKKGW
jgi:hypothetical protein